LVGLPDEGERLGTSVVAIGRGPTLPALTDVSLSIFRSKFKKTRIQMIDYNV